MRFRLYITATYNYAYMQPNLGSRWRYFRIILYNLGIPLLSIRSIKIIFTYGLPIPFNIHRKLSFHDKVRRLCNIKSIKYYLGSRHITYYIFSFLSFDTIAIYRFQFCFGLYIVFRVPSIFGF